MKLNRKGVIGALAGLALVGVLAGGAGIAMGATPSTPPSHVPSAGQTMGDMDDMGNHRHGMMETDGASDAAGMNGTRAPMVAAAAYLGLSQDNLQAQLLSGKSLADVATAQGKSVSGLEDAMVTAMTTHLNASTALTAQERAAILAQMKSRLALMVTATHSPGSGLQMRGGMMGR